MTLIRKVMLGAIFLASFLMAPNNANGNYDKYILGFNSGYTWWAGTHIGLNLQYYFSSHWGVQLEFHYQRKIHRVEYTAFHPEDSYSRIEDDSFTMCYLNVIYRVTTKKKNFSWYISAGAGIWHMDPSIIFSKVGNGMKWSFSPRLSLHLGFSAWPAPLFIKGSRGFKLFPSGGPNFVSLHVGLEYGF